MLHVFAAASPAQWPLWVDIVLLAGLFFAAVTGTLARRSQRMSPSMRGYARWNMARHHPFLYGALLAVLMFFGFFWIAATHHIALRAAFIVALLIGAGAGFLGAIAGFILRRSQPIS